MAENENILNVTGDIPPPVEISGLEQIEPPPAPPVVEQYIPDAPLDVEKSRFGHFGFWKGRH